LIAVSGFDERGTLNFYLSNHSSCINNYCNYTNYYSIRFKL